MMNLTFPKRLSSLLMALLATACVDATDMTEADPPPRLGWTSAGAPMPLELVPVDLTPENMRRMERIFGHELGLGMPVEEVDVGPGAN